MRKIEEKLLHVSHFILKSFENYLELSFVMHNVSPTIEFFFSCMIINLAWG